MSDACLTCRYWSLCQESVELKQQFEKYSGMMQAGKIQDYALLEWCRRNSMTKRKKGEMKDHIVGPCLVGECRRHAPTSPDRWICTNEDEWCGDYHRKESEVEK